MPTKIAKTITWTDSVDSAGRTFYVGYSSPNYIVKEGHITHTAPTTTGVLSSLRRTIGFLDDSTTLKLDRAMYTALYL